MAIPFITIALRIMFREIMLGTAPLSKEIYKHHVLVKALKTGKKHDVLEDDEIVKGELELIDDLPEQGMTGFRRYPGSDGNSPVGERFCIPGYMVKGCLRNGAQVLNGTKGFPSNFKKKVTDLVFITPENIMLPFTDDDLDETGRPKYICERPIRIGATATQPERTAIARSEYLPAGREISFGIKMLALNGLKGIRERHLRDLVEYGELHGLGQWANSGKGRFELLDYTVSGDEPAEEEPKPKKAAKKKAAVKKVSTTEVVAE